MKVKKINRYYCDFCKKANCSGASISKHEKRCTKNPNRECGMCKFMEQEQPAIETMLAILPDPNKLVKRTSYLERDKVEYVSEDWSLLEEELEKVFPALREKSGGCPACIMAALRQKHIPVTIARDKKLFDFTEECKQILNFINKNREMNTYHYYYTSGESTHVLYGKLERRACDAVHYVQCQGCRIFIRVNDADIVCSHEQEKL